MVRLAGVSERIRLMGPFWLKLFCNNRGLRHYTYLQRGFSALGCSALGAGGCHYMFFVSLAALAAAQTVAPVDSGSAPIALAAGQADAQSQTPNAPIHAVATVPVSTGAAPAQPTVVLPPGTCCLVPSGSIIEISIDDPLDSKTSTIGQHFAIHLAAPLMLADGNIVIAAGTKGVGEVIHAARAHMGGKAGELLLVARYLDVNGTQVPLRGFRMGGQGKDNSNLVVAATIAVGVAGMFISGGEKRVVPGTMATAKIAVDTILPSLAPLAPAPAPAPALIPASANTAIPSPVVSTKEIKK